MCQIGYLGKSRHIRHDTGTGNPPVLKALKDGSVNILAFAEVVGIYNDKQTGCLNAMFAHASSCLSRTTNLIHLLYILFNLNFEEITNLPGVATQVCKEVIYGCTDIVYISDEMKTGPKQ